MKKIFIFFSLCFLMSPLGFAMDEEDIPPPPMPDYMEDAGYEVEGERGVASEDNLGGQTKDEVTQEFLQAGDDDLDVDDVEEVDEVAEGPIEEGNVEQIDDSPQMFVDENPSVAAVPEEVNPVETAEPEFEQAGMDDSNQVKEAYMNEGQDSVQEDTVIDANAEIAAESAEPVAEKLASVEEKLEQREAEQEATLAGARKPSGKKKFKSGMYKFDDKCVMRSEPNALSSEAGVIKAGRKLWIDPHNGGWHKAYKKTGTVYISSDCLQ